MARRSVGGVDGEDFGVRFLGNLSFRKHIPPLLEDGMPTMPYPSHRACQPETCIHKHHSYSSLPQPDQRVEIRLHQLFRIPLIDPAADGDAQRESAV